MDKTEYFSNFRSNYKITQIFPDYDCEQSEQSAFENKALEIADIWTARLENGELWREGVISRHF